MTIQFSRRARLTPQSPIRKLSPLAEKARAKGHKVYHLNIGQPDIKTPKEFFEGVKLFKDDVIAYEASRGLPALCKAWAGYANRTLGLNTQPEEYLITTGASEALVFAFSVCCDPEDDIIVFDPTYANYMGFAALCGINLTPVQTEISSNFALPEAEVITRSIGARTKAILLCSPNNPTGTVYTDEELKLCVDICNERNLFLIVDETYREFVYDGRSPRSVLHLGGDLSRVMVIDSLSKRFSLCGARIGCIMSQNEELMAIVRTMAQARLSCPSIEQFASAHMLNTIPESFVKDAVREFEHRRNTLFESLSAISGLEAHLPQGAFYVVVRLPVPDAEAFSSFLLGDFEYKGWTTFLAPAAGFYVAEGRGEGEVRVAYVLNASDIKSAVGVIEQGLDAFGRKL